MNSTAYESTRLVNTQLNQAYRTQFESRAGTEKKAPPVAELLYLFCIGFLAVGAVILRTELRDGANVAFRALRYEKLFCATWSGSQIRPQSGNA